MFNETLAPDPTIVIDGIEAGMCLHCEKKAIARPDGLCEHCGAQDCVTVLYIRRRGWTPKFEAHLMRLRRRAEQRRPLFDGPLVVGKPMDRSIHPLRTHG